MKYYGILLATTFHCANASSSLASLREKKNEIQTAVEWTHASKTNKKLPQALACIEKQSHYIEDMESFMEELQYKLYEEKEKLQLFRDQIVILIQENNENKTLVEKLNKELVSKDEESQKMLSRHETDITYLEEFYEKEISNLTLIKDELEEKSLDSDWKYKKIETEYKQSLNENINLLEENKDLKTKIISLSKKYESRKVELENYKKLYQSMLNREEEDETITLLLPDEEETTNS